LEQAEQSVSQETLVLPPQNLPRSKKIIEEETAKSTELSNNSEFE